METSNVFHLEDEFSEFTPFFWNLLEKNGKSGMTRVIFYSTLIGHNLAVFRIY